MGRSWASLDQGSTQPSILSPAIPKFLLPLSFSVPVSGLGLVLPPASHHPHTRAHRWQCPKQLWHRALLGRLSRAGHKPFYPALSICLHIPPPVLSPHCSPQHTQMSMLAKPLGTGGKGWPALCQTHRRTPQPSPSLLKKASCTSLGGTWLENSPWCPLPRHQDLSPSLCPLVQEWAVDGAS